MHNVQHHSILIMMKSPPPSLSQTPPHEMHCGFNFECAQLKKLMLPNPHNTSRHMMKPAEFKSSQLKDWTQIFPQSFSMSYLCFIVICILWHFMFSQCYQ
jgi:hypothetical protein